MLLLLIPIVFLVVGWIAWRRRHVRLCRWREDRSGAKGALMRYTCVACGAEAYRAKGPPDRCLSNLPDTRL